MISDSFHLLVWNVFVYWKLGGFGSPKFDPLDFETGHPEMADDEVYERLDILCKDDAQGDWKGQMLNRIAQSRQNDWYGAWIGEMARIVKPGAPVIVEQVEWPYCNNDGSWGGVTQDFFRDAVVNDTYSWNVKPDSLQFEEDMIFGKRYHVFMLKEEK